MNGPEALAILTSLFNEASQLNRQALQALQAGQSTASLEALFARKNALNEQLQQLQAQLQPQRLNGQQDGVQAAFQAQREAATSEALLAEQLGKIVPLDGKVVAAYERFRVENRTSKLDSSV